MFKGQEKRMFLAGDFNINSLDYSQNTIVHDFFHLAFQNSIFPVINRPARVTQNSATIIDHILTNTIIDSPLHSGIVKTDISDHFAVFCLLKTNFEPSNIKNIIIKRDMNKASKVTVIFKKVKNLAFQIINQYLFFLVFQKSWNEYCIADCMIILPEASFYLINNLNFELVTQLSMLF